MDKPSKKIFLLDAMALIYRAHFAFSKNPRVNSKGVNTGAAFGFTNTLLEVLNKEKPTHLGVAFDTPAPTFRHESFEAYKAQRQAQPEDITIAIPYVKEILQALCIPVLEKDGYEADDIIGTLAKKAASAGFEVYMMTPDKDFSQLVGSHVYLYKPAFMGNGAEVWDEKKVLEKWAIRSVDQVTDILGLQGDAVDNIPGIPGIGEKTAKALIAEYGSVENLLQNTDKLKGKQKENVVTFAEQGLLSKQLATIDTDVPVEFHEEDLKISEPDKEAAARVFDELEFRVLKKRILGEEKSETIRNDSANKTGAQTALFEKDKGTMSIDPIHETSVNTVLKDTISTVTHDYYCIDTTEKRKRLIDHLSALPSFCFDTETDSLDALETSLVGMSFAWYPREAYYVPIPEGEEGRQIVEEFKSVFENENIEKVGQNIKFDFTVLRNYGIELRGRLFDTMLAHYLLEPDMRHNMDVLSESYLNYLPVSITSLIGKKGSEQKNMRSVPLDLITDYAAEDADVTWQLKEHFFPDIQEKNLGNLLYNVEGRLIPVLADMEREGVRVDPQALRELSADLETQSKEAERRIFEAAGQTFNIASPKQLGEILFDKLKLEKNVKKTSTGQYATGEEILSKMAHEHQIARDILEYRELQKLKSTYTDALPLLICERDGRVHTSYNQAVAATGRLSSTSPNLQNIPVRTERGREIRKAFVPKNEEYVILSADYSQIELRIMASFSKDENMIEAFRKNIDIHAVTASKVFKVSLEQVTPEMRRKAKMVNFGIIYGISAFGLAQRLDIPRKEAAEIIDAYFKEFPAVKRYIDESVSKARELEYTQTVLGRRRYLRDINSRNMTVRGYAERNAVNAPLQGTAADMIKLAMIGIHERIKTERFYSKMILQVHDELVFDAHREEVEKLKQMVEEVMKSALPLEVPMEVGFGMGKNWLEAH